jgi:hypothetical protein
MDQRRLRPGDSLDDYCPRERRLTDHVIVAVVDDVVKQTRCVACDTEHPYKDGRVPPRRKKAEGAPALVRRDVEVETESGSSDNGHEPHPNLIARPERKPPKSRRAAAPPPVPPSVLPVFEPSPPAPPVESGQAVAAAEPEPGPTERGEEDEGPVHRRLIRATLPRPEGQVPARPLPDFTLRQPGARTPFGRGGAANRFGKGGGNRAGSPWQGKPHGHHGNRAASAQVPGGEPHGRHKPGRSRSARHHHKKTR